MSSATATVADNVNEIISQTISQRKGANVRLCWKRPVKTKKSAGLIKVEKEVCTTGRVGIDHENKKSTIAGRADGSLPAVNAGLPWGNWEWFPYIIEHNGQRYLRLNPPIDNEKRPIKVSSVVTWFLNDTETTYEKIEAYLMASEKRNDREKSVYNVKIESMNYVGNVD